MSTLLSLYLLIHEMIFLYFVFHVTDCMIDDSLFSTFIVPTPSTVINSTVIVPTPTRSPSMPSTNPHTTTMELAIIAGTIVPFFIILCLAVLITIILCFIYYRYKHKSGRRISSSQERAVPPQEMEELYKMTNNVSRDSQQGTTVRQNVGKFYS